MTSLDLAAIRERAEAATEGPWDYAGQGWVRHGDMSVGSDQIPEVLAATVLSDADGAFIAHARTDIPALLAEIDRLNATIQRVREIERQMDEYSHRSGPCTGLNCGGCQAGRFSTALRRALTEALEGER